MCQKSDWKRHRIFCRDAGESNVEEDQHAAEITEIDLDNEEGMSGPRTHKEWKADLLKRVQQRGELAFRWPWYCGASELSDLIQSCELKCLRRLVLRRPVRPVMSLSGEFTHHPNECLKQMEALRSALPDTKQVLCGTCDNVQWKCFQFTIFGMF
ncbi:hypothetical protein FOCC_FOCC006018 [Frankliniella occidentalis]|nr:hypothetical protein FOCC_FOCC006018 [Frankliniella occidentalis]